MLAISERINSLVKTVIYFTKKSKRTTTPKPFNNPHLTQRGIVVKQPRSYNYDLPQNLPNRHLYWNRSVQNKILRQSYRKRRMQRLQINPIYADGKLADNRPLTQLIFELTNINILKQSVNRTLNNIHCAITRFPAEFSHGGKDADVLKFAIQDFHDRHLTTLNFYTFSTYCQLRHRAKIPPTQSLAIHFFRHLEAAKVNGNSKLTLQRMANLSQYMFSRQYPQSINILYKKQVKFQLFGQGQQTFTTLQDIVPYIFSPQYMKQLKQKIKANDASCQSRLKALSSIPGGMKLIQNINKIE